MASLCERWADESAALARIPSVPDEGRVHDLLAKARKLIEVVQGGLPRGGLETVPRDLVFEEYKLCHVAALQAVHAAGRRRTADRIIASLSAPIRYDLDGSGTISITRRFTITGEAAEKIRERVHRGEAKPSQIAYALAGARFGIPTETARQLATGKRKKPKRRVGFDLPIGLLASSFYDMCQHDGDNKPISREEAFDALWHCGYSRFCLFYRLHHAHVSDNQLPSLIEADDMELLRDCVRSRTPPATAD